MIYLYLNYGWSQIVVVQHYSLGYLNNSHHYFSAIGYLVQCCQIASIVCCSILDFEQTATFCVRRSTLLVCVTCCVLKRLTRAMLFGVLWLLFVSVCMDTCLFCY
jgi:hypothetical protein